MTRTRHLVALAVGIAALHLLVSLIAPQTAAAAEMARLEFPAPPTLAEHIADSAAYALLFPLALAAIAAEGRLFSGRGNWFRSPRAGRVRRAKRGSGGPLPRFGG